MTLEETLIAVRKYRDKCKSKNLDNNTSNGIEIGINVDQHTLTWAEYWLTKMSDEENRKHGLNNNFTYF